MHNNVCLFDYFLAQKRPCYSNVIVAYKMNLDYDSVAFLDFHILIAQNITLGIMLNNISVIGVLAFQLWHLYK